MPFFLIAPLTWLGNLAFSAIVWFVTRGGIKFTVAITIIGLVGTAISAFLSSMDADIGSVFPSLATFVVPFIPSNTGFCVSIVVSTEIAATGYKLTMKFLDWKARILLA